MSSRANRLQPAADLARERQEQAMQKLAEQQQRMAKAEQQLVELERYREEYSQTAGGVSVAVLLNRRQFVERIDQVIGQQRIEVARQQRHLDHMRGQWREAHAREQALGSVIDRYREQERKSEERREQNEIDERMQHRRPARDWSR
ncbi:flagellar export protein FliJ [Dyella solisilvae]|uniref:Flagellar FliJ protein n=1 Tax=Dyella solisilvae TaxID=1920168 RepID=A0A370K524_9GAMM|nr:flagellar export protein FliJ [Dyella solisilvae]RDI97734.1 flagellar export protein FliJ [Dyella solisilvae]